jgi:hypothetical protein
LGGDGDSIVLGRICKRTRGSLGCVIEEEGGVVMAQ